MPRRMAIVLATVLAKLTAGGRSDKTCDASAPSGRCGDGRANRASRDSLLLQMKTAVTTNPHEGRVNVTHQLLGCFPRSAGDVDDVLVFQDRKCVNATNVSNSSKEGPCRSGLPFFRFALQRDQSYLDCFTFCLSKGLDLCGVVYSDRAGADECRCGASSPNQGIWGGKSPHSRLLLLESSVPQDDERCKVVVWQYTGGFEDDSVPAPLMHLSVSDEAYIDGIAHQVDPDAILEEDSPDEVVWPPHTLGNSTQREVSLVQGICVDNNDPERNGYGYSCAQLRQYCNDAAYGPGIRQACPLSCGQCLESQKWGWEPCYPKACGPAGGPWPFKSGSTVVVNYYYDATVINDGTRRAAFESAKQEWESKTCVRFSYSQSLPTIRVWADPYEPNGCSSGIGFPGYQGIVSINMGWCKNANHIGNIAHELGHALGMNHENKRPDAAPQNQPDGFVYRNGKLFTPDGYKGPYLSVKWDQVAPLSQWKPNEFSYFGSERAGYAYYDFGSLMHYRLTNGATLASGQNKAWESVIGQRDGLSDGDIYQFRDMYGC